MNQVFSHAYSTQQSIYNILDIDNLAPTAGKSFYLNFS